MLDSFLFGHDPRDRSPLPDTNPTGTFSSGSANRTEVKHLEDRLDRLSLVCMAMWSLIRDKTNLTEQDLLDRVRLIDLLDGQEDGKATRTVSKCTACGRPMHPRHKKCIYCGDAKLVESAFDAL